MDRLARNLDDLLGKNGLPSPMHKAAERLTRLQADLDHVTMKLDALCKHPHFSEYSNGQLQSLLEEQIAISLRRAVEPRG